MKTFDFPQYSPEWWATRRGVPTASEFSSILTPKTGKLSAASGTYIQHLIGDTFDTFYPRADEAATAAMRRGTAMEPESRRFLEFELGEPITQVGFCLSDDGRFGCSPDGLIPAKRQGIELMNPSPHTHVRFLLEGILPDEKKAQCHGGLIISGYDEWLFCSHCPGLPPFIYRVTPDDYTAKLRAALEEFWTVYQRDLATVRGLLSEIREAA